MKGDILTQLQRISNQLDCIGRDMREEERVYAAEQHYNEWMDKAGMSHLKTK